MLNENLFLEFPEHFAFVYAQELRPGEWTSWVTFERKSDHAAKQTKVPAIRHGLQGIFPSVEEAIQAARDTAQRLAKDGDIGL